MDLQNYVQSIQSAHGCSYFTALKHVEFVLNCYYKDEKDRLAIKRDIADLGVSACKKEDNNCPHCKIEMEMWFDEVYVCCPECGRLKKYTSETSVMEEIKKPTFNPHQHFAKWINNILGYTPPKDPCLDDIRKYISEKKITNLTLERLRKILKITGHSDKYKYTSYIFRELTGDGPPNIPDEILRRAEHCFRRIIKVRQEMRLTNGVLGKNNPSYQFLIYKIFDVILSADDIENRRVLHFIHLPADKTLQKRNSEWKILWNKLN